MMSSNENDLIIKDFYISFSKPLMLDSSGSLN